MGLGVDLPPAVGGKQGSAGGEERMPLPSGLGGVVGRSEHCRALGELPALCPDHFSGSSGNEGLNQPDP